MTTRRTFVLRALTTASAGALVLAACSSNDDGDRSARQASAAKTYEVCFENASTEGLSINSQNGNPEWLPVVPGERSCVAGLPGSSTPPTMKMGTSERDLRCTLQFDQYDSGGQVIDVLDICGRANAGSKIETWRVKLPVELQMTVTPSSREPKLSWNLKFEDYP